MSKWLDLMMDEVRRKQREQREAQQEIERRKAAPDKANKTDKPATREPAQSK